MDISYIIIAVLYNAVILYSIWKAVRGLMKKTSGIPPCRLIWAKVDVETVSEKDIELAGDTETSMYDEYRYHKTGTRYNSLPIQRTAKYSKLKYTYNGKSYELKTMKYSAGDIGTGIYCRKNKPEITKVYKPKPPILTGAAISYFLIAAFMLICEIAVLPQLLS